MADEEEGAPEEVDEVPAISTAAVKAQLTVTHSTPGVAVPLPIVQPASSRSVPRFQRLNLEEEEDEFLLHMSASNSAGTSDPRAAADDTMNDDHDDDGAGRSGGVTWQFSLGGGDGEGGDRADSQQSSSSDIAGLVIAAAAASAADPNNNSKNVKKHQKHDQQQLNMSSMCHQQQHPSRAGGLSPCPAPCDPVACAADIMNDRGHPRHHLTHNPTDPNGFYASDHHGFVDPRLPSSPQPTSSGGQQQQQGGGGRGGGGGFKPGPGGGVPTQRRPIMPPNGGALQFVVASGSTPAISGAKHLQTEQVMSKHSYKSRLNRYQELIEQAIAVLDRGDVQSVQEGLYQLTRLMDRAWATPRIGHDLAYALCDYLRDCGHLDKLVGLYLDDNIDDRLRLPVARALENILSSFTRTYLVQGGFLMPLMVVALTKYTGPPEMLAAGVSLMENMFKHSPDTSRKMIDAGVLDYIINTFKSSCRQASEQSSATLRHAALAILNLTMHSDAECQQIMITKNVPDWLYILASHRDDIICYYACLATVMLASNKELGSAVKRSGTLNLVEPFLHSHRPETFVNADHKIARGRPRDWLQKMVSLLTSRLREANGLAAFHFCMEAIIKKQHDRLEVFLEIGATSALKEVASSPYEIAAKLASQALTIIGETVPYKLSQQVPLWSVQDVRYWVTKIGFEQYATVFADQKVDGDLLLLMTDEELQDDIGMRSGLLRKRFLRELEGLKIAADYSSVDPTELDSFMLSVCERMSKYTYQMLDMGVERSLLPTLTDDILASTCGMANPVHRIRLLQALQDCKTIDDMEINMLSRQIDIFISYRRRSGNQLASLIKVLLQLRGYKVFIDVDRLYAGQFDMSLLKNIMAAKTFILVLTEHSLDRWIGDDGVHDWVHKEVRCALENHKNIVPIFDVNFEFPDETSLPLDIRVVTRLNGIRWVHEYQDACIDKLERFLHPPAATAPTAKQSTAAAVNASLMRRSISVNQAAVAAAAAAGTNSMSSATLSPRKTTTTATATANHPGAKSPVDPQLQQQQLMMHASHSMNVNGYGDYERQDSSSSTNTYARPRPAKKGGG